jgi:hypothetical protein
VSTELNRSSNSLAVTATRIFESLGLLNKGSAALSKGEEVAEASAESKFGVMPPSLNVTRVGGLAALVGSVGVAALALFVLPENADVLERAFSFISTALVVSAALISAAIILSADIRARTAVSVADGRNGIDSKPEPDASKSQSVDDFAAGWRKSIDVLSDVDASLRPAQSRGDFTRLWLRAEASKGFSQQLEPPAGLTDEHRLLTNAQEEVCRLINDLRKDPSSTSVLKSDIALLVSESRVVLNGIQP